MSSFEVFGNMNNQLPSGISAKENDHVLSKVVLDEADLYTNLFCPLLEELGNSRSNLKRIISFILEYIRSLEEEQIPVQHFLNELLINLLVQNGSWYQLHQLLQYHVIVDSKPLGIFFDSTYKLMYKFNLKMVLKVEPPSKTMPIFFSMPIIVPGKRLPGSWSTGNRHASEIEKFFRRNL